MGQHARPKGWEHHANRAYMKELCAYWVEELDGRKQEAVFNRFPQCMAQVDGADIHVIHEAGSDRRRCRCS